VRHGEREVVSAGDDVSSWFDRNPSLWLFALKTVALQPRSAVKGGRATVGHASGRGVRAEFLGRSRPKGKVPGPAGLHRLVLHVQCLNRVSWVHAQFRSRQVSA
jgi:hypothetical protein